MAETSFECESDDSSSDDEGQISSEDSDVPDLPPPRVKRFRAKIPVEEKWYVHAKSRLVHRYESDSHDGIKILVCGKRSRKPQPGMFYASLVTGGDETFCDLVE